MKGVIRTVVPNKGYGFIVAGNGGDYFFHRNSFNGHWEDLETDFQKSAHKQGNRIEVTFDSTDSPKGPRAENVRRLDWPNNAA